MPIDYNEFAKKIKAKYPEYKDVDNYTLASKMVEKYPEYKGEVDLKKKDLTGSGLEEPSSERLTTTTTKATVSSSSKVKPDGTYSFPGEDNAIYKKEGGEWFKSFKDENKYYPITKGDVQNRLKSLESNAVLVKPLSTTTTIKPATSSSSRRWDDVTVEPLSKKKYRTDDYIDQVQNAQKKLKTTGQNVESTFEQPKETKPPIKFDGLSDKEAMQMMAEDFGKKEFAAYSSINKMPSANTLKDLDDETSEYSLNKQFEGTNLKFKKIGSQLTVTSKIGYGINSTILNESTIDLSNPNADKELKSFVSTNIVKRSEREQFENAQTVEDLVELVGSNPNKFRSTLLEGVDVEKYFEKERQALNGEMSRANADAYDSDLKLYEQKVAKFNQDVKGGKMSKSDFESRSAELDNERKSLEKRRDIISNVIYKAEKIDKLTSNLEKANVITAAEREKQGSRIGLFFRGAGEGLTDVSQAMIDFGIAGAAAVIDAKTFANAIKPGEYERLKELGFSDDEIKNEIQKSVKNRANKVLRSVPDAIGMGTTEEYAKSSDRGIIDQAIYAVGESFGAVGGGLAAGALGSSGVTAGFFAMSYNALEDQMRGPQFDALSENEKKIMSVPYGLVIGALEKLGARVATGAAKNKTLGMFSEYIMAKTFSSLPKNASLLEIKSAIDKSVAASVANGMLKITGAGIVEGGTEFTQQIFEGVEKDIANRIIQSNQLETAKEEGGGAVSKEIYNQIVQNKFFKDAADLSTTEGIGQLLKESGNAFLVGAVAGGMTSSISVGVAEPISNKVSNNKFAVYRDIILNDDAREGAISSINKKVEDNELTREEADQQIKSINESYPALRQIPTGFSVGAQREAFGLLMERESLNKEIEGKDPNLVAAQTERVKEINEQLKGLSYAVQEQATSEVSVQPGAESGGEMAQGKPEARPQEVTQEGQQAQEVNQSKFVAEEATRLAAQENISTEERQSLVDKLYDDPIAYAQENNTPDSPSENFLNSLEQQPTAEETAVVEEQASKPITQEQIETKRKETEAKIKRKDLFDGVGAFSSTLGNSDKAAVPFSHRENNGIELVEFAHPDTGSIDVIITGTSENDFVGFYRIYENGKPTNRWSSKFENQSRNKENFKTMIGGVQELLPAGHEYTEKTSISTDGLRVWNQQLDRGYELQYDENGNVVTNEVAINGDAIVNELGIPVNKGKFQNINVTSQAEFQKVKEALLPYLEKLGLNESNIRWMSGPLKDSGTVKIDLPILKKSQPATQKEKATDIVGENKKNINLATDETGKPKAGNRLFNEPLKAVAEIANRYFQRVFGSQRPTFEGTTELDVERAKRIAAAYEAMENNPNDPEVRRAYEAMAKETIDQYQDFLDAGYIVEINNEEPYANSADMIEDLRNNNRIKIFSTEAGFGDEPITPKQRAENPLLAITEFTDVNGQPMLVNDLFRAVHDFFGHAELGNSFGPKGEENAWNVHARMYSPLARRAMTTETRGQNSYVNFSGVNERVEALREEARKLREEGKLDEAAAIVNQIYDEAKFAEQKIGLLPQEFSEVDQDNILTADTKDATNLQKALDALDKIEKDLDKFGKETLGINIPVATMRAIIKLAKVLVKTGITLQDAIIKAAEQKNVSAQDALNAIMFMSETIKQPIKKVVVNEMAALKSQIRLEAKSAREAKGDLNTKRKALAAAITGMVRQGKITAVQARSIINKVSRVNLDNPVMVDRLISYAERVFDRADYQETLSKAAKIRKSIKKAMKSKDLQAEVAAMAKKFSSVDPFMVEDIDQYIENADKVLNAVRPVRETEVPLRQSADIEAISDYTTAEVERQEANKKAELLALNKYLVEAGIVTDDMTAKEIQEMIDIIAAEEYEVENADKKLNFLKNRFEFMSGVIEEMIVNNKDIFTDEALDLTQSQKDLMREILKFDIDKLSVKQAAQVLEAMDNFINNGITSGLEAVVKGYIGNENANKLAASGLKSRPLRMYWNKAVGKFFGEQFVSLPLLIERMFPGMKKGLKLMSEMGLTDVIRGAAKADREHKMIMKDYTSQEFSKGKGFKKAENVYERGMIAFLSRNLAGTKTEMRNEFLRRVKMVEESINALMTGSETERKMGEAYQKIFDKLKVSSQDLDVIKANAEQMNLDAVNWMTQQWAEKYSDLSDISLSVYNAILGSDTNYTPDRYKGLDESDIKLDEKLLERGSAFMGGLEYTDKNKSGVLIETTRPKALPKGRFVSLDFDVNNFSSLKGAMIDIETAPAIRQVDGFINSDGYKRIINGDDRKILNRRINNYIIAVKGKNAFNRDSMKTVERLANFLGSLGVGKALGGLDQTVKQTAPVIINTLINAGRFDGLNFEMNAAINRSGMPIANRGIEAISGIESIDALIDKKGTTAAEIAKAIEKVSQMYMKALLSKPDVWVARSSFISYYKNYLKTNGMSTDIDWQTHEWNQEAMNYAQMMVDRQQNISDEKLAGSFMNSPDSWKSVTRKVILPFATFIINQKNRMHNDLIALFGIGAETSTEDKKRAARSLVGLSAEMLAYQGIAYFLKTMVYDNIAAWITGEDDEEEKKERSFFGIKMTKKQWNATKFPVKSLVSDVLSPFPLFDGAVVFGFDELMSNFPMISKEDIDKAIQDQNDARALKGQDPMDAEQEANLIKNLKDKNTYAVTFQKESLGRQYGVPGIAFDTYTELADMAQLAYTGEFEDDMGFGPKKKYISKKDQELVKWTLLPMVLYSTGLVPKDAGVVSRKVVATVKKRSISETKLNNTNELKTELGRKPKDWEESLVMNTTKKVPTLVEAIKFAERFGGLTESQGKEYAKLIEITGDYGYLDLKRIQEGETADQILKK